MTSLATTILQLALALLMSVQSSADATSAQRQQAITVATQAIQIAQQTLAQIEVGASTTGNGIPAIPTHTTISTGTTVIPANAPEISVCDLQNRPATYTSQKVYTKGTVSMSGTNYLTDGVFYLNDGNCKIKISSWIPIGVGSCPPSGTSVCGGSGLDIMSDYIGKSVTLYGQMNSQTDNTGTYYVFQGNPVTSTTLTSLPPMPKASATTGSSQ